MSSETYWVCAACNRKGCFGGYDCPGRDYRQPATDDETSLSSSVRTSPGDEGGKSPTYDRASIADLTARLAKAEEALVKCSELVRRFNGRQNEKIDDIHGIVAQALDPASVMGEG